MEEQQVFEFPSVSLGKVWGMYHKVLGAKKTTFVLCGYGSRRPEEESASHRVLTMSRPRSRVLLAGEGPLSNDDQMTKTEGFGLPGARGSNRVRTRVWI